MTSTNVISLKPKAAAKPNKPTRQNLTDTFARSASLPLAGYKLIRDAKQPAFCLRVTAQGSKAWCIDKWSRGQMRRVAIAPIADIGAEEARKQAQILIAQLHNGVDPLAERRQAERDTITLADGVDSYIEKAMLAERTQKDYQRLIHNELAPWSRVTLTAITPAKAREMHAEITGDTRADYAMRLLRAVMFMHDQPNPCARVAGRKFPWRQKSAARPARLEPGMARAAWRAFGKLDNETAGAYFRTLLLTAMRPAEGATMTASMVNLRAKRIDLPKTKNGQEHRIYIAPELARVLAPHLKGKQGDELVFPDCGDPRKSLQAAIESLGVPFSRHDLRKLTARIAQECGIAHPVIRTMLNHSVKTGDVTSRHYAQPTESQLREAFERVAKFATKRPA